MIKAFTPAMPFHLGEKLGLLALLVFTISFSSFNAKANVFSESEMMTPIVNCPQDVHVSCLHYTGNPSDYGQPHVFGAGANIIEHAPQFFTNSCGIGYIIRTWTIHFSYGSFHCTQRITITGSGYNFGAHNIHWPLDYTVNGCHADLHPDNIPHPYSRPSWTSAPCSMIGVSYQDQVFNFNAPGFHNTEGGCKKILRTWKIIDWCTFHGPSGAGMWTHIQVIKIMDNHPPTFTFCPPDFTVGTYDNNCNGAYVNFPRPTAVDNCSQHVTIRNNSPFTYNSGSDASGFYPLGTHIVRFTADDGCGNTAVCNVTVMVRDLKKPTPVCHYGLTTTLMPMDGGGFVQLDPKVFNAGSFDNCTPQSQLRFALDRSTFTCEDRGVQNVRLFVTDLSNNTDFCNTFVRIQDNMGVCPPDTTGGIVAGLVKFVNGLEMEGVAIYSKMENEDPDDMTNQHGLYALENLADGRSYEIMPSKTGSLIEGVSTLDLIQIRKHITGEQRLNNPYKIIAADINRDGQVSIQDYLQLRMMLLLGLNEFPGMKSWRFIDSDYEFTNPENPLAEAFTEVYMIEEHGKTDMEVGFIGVKLGDIDGSCMPIPDTGDGDWASVSNRAVNTFEIKTPERNLIAGNNITVDLIADNKIQLHGLQFTIAFDPEILAFNGVESGVLNGLTDRNMGLHKLDEGFITLSWEQLIAVGVDKDQILAGLHFTVKNFGKISDAISITSAPLVAEAYDIDMNIADINFRVEGQSHLTDISGVELLQSSPNPFTNECIISFHVPANQYAEIVIHDLAGKMIKLINIDAVKGLNNVVLQGRDLPAPGMYTYTLVSDGHRATKKLLFH